MMAGLDRVPAVIKEASDEEVSLIALVENIQRENLGYIEEANAYRTIRENSGRSQLALSEKLGKNQSTISNKIRLLSLPKDIQDILVENKLTDGFNVKQTEKLVDDYIAQNDSRERERNKICHISYKLYINTLKRAFNDMELNEKGATFVQEDMGNDLRITIMIPKEIQGMVG